MTSTQPAADPRTTDASSRYLLPFPIATLYRLTRTTHRDGDRFGYTLKLVEGIVRFLALCNLADAVSQGTAEKQVRDWLKPLRLPGFGKLAELFAGATSALCVKGGPFIHETATLCKPGPWQDALSSLIDVRNRFVHDEVYVPDDEARPLLSKVEGPAKELLSGIQFLRHYRLGILEHFHTTGRGEVHYKWYAARGLEETCEPISLRTRENLMLRWPMLIDVRSGEALHLSPFFNWGLAEGDLARHVFWLQHLVDRDNDETIGCFRHPALRQATTRGFADPEEPDGAGVALSDYLARRTAWPGRRALVLDEASQNALRDRLEPGCFEDRYQLIGKLGEGGMGAVWEAFDRRLQRTCAIKMLRPEMLRSPDALRRFDREGRILASLRDSRIVGIHGVEVGRGDVPYLVMERVDGEDLEALVRRAGPCTPEEAVALLTEATEALQVVHGAGIVHRDVKPNNFMRTDAGVRMIDFGIALAPGGTRYTHGPDVMGTPGYSAPEQRLGKFSVRSDVFAAGRLLFFLLAGRPPTHDGEKLRAAAPMAPEQLEQTYERATAVTPEDRFSSARELAESAAAALELAREQQRAPSESKRDKAPQINVHLKERRHQQLDVSSVDLAATMQRLEKTLPWPIAVAVRQWGFSPPNEERLVRHGPWVIEVTLAYLLDRALALVVAGGNGLRLRGDLRRMLARPTLGALLDVLRAIELLHPDEALTSQARVAEAVGRVIAYRNLLTHQGPQPNAELAAEIVPSILQVLEAVAAHLGDREEGLILIQGSKTRRDGSATCRAYRLTGASISGWEPIDLVLPSPVLDGPALSRQESLVSMWPFAIAAPEAPGVLLFAGLGRTQVDWLSPTARHPALEGEADAEVRQSIERLLGPDDNPSPSLALSGVGRILSGARGLK